jgi:hypothetical protein
MWAKIESLREFCGTIRTIIREKPRATIAEVLGEGESYQCTVPQCGTIFANEKGIKTHFTGHHEALLQKDWTAPRCKLIHRFELVGEVEIDEDADMMERRQGGMEMEVRMGIEEEGMEKWRNGRMEEWRKTLTGKYPEKRGIGRGCRRDRKGRISESKRDELSRETRKIRLQWTKKDGVRNS